MLPTTIINQHILLAFSITFVTAITFFTIFPGEDPYRCRALIQTGRWVDPPLANGSRMPFAHWQPDGCVMRRYESEDIQTCLQGRKLVFGGDSTSRRPMWQTAVMLTNEDQIAYDSTHTNHRGDINATYHGITLHRDANQFLHTDFDEKQLLFMAHLREYKREKRRGFSLPIEDQTGPAIFYFSAGVWYTKAEDFPGLDIHSRTQLYTEALLNISSILGPNSGKQFYNQPLDELDGVGNQMFYFPPHGPNWRVEERRDRIPQTEEMRGWLRKHEEKEINFPVVWANARMAEGQDDVWNGDSTGFHVSDEVNTVRVNLVFNARCNARMDRLVVHEGGTCCTDYGPKPMVQLITVGAAILWLILCVAFTVYTLLTTSTSSEDQQQQQPRFPIFSIHTAGFPLALLMSYFADRTQMMPKGERIYNPSTFFIFISLIIVVALATIRKTPKEESEYQPIGDQLGQEPHDFLTKPITQEWKGWMVLMLLAYHWCSASERQPLFITSRIFISAFILLLAYTHTTSYLTTADFSLHKLSSRILRLNLLSFALTSTMNTNSLTYYIVPLLTFWTVITYLTLFSFSHLNDNPAALLTKVAVSGIAVPALLNFTSLIPWCHWLAALIFNIQSSLETWTTYLTTYTLPPFIGITLAILSKHNPPSTIISSTSIFLTAAFVVSYLFYLFTPLFTLDVNTTYLNLTSFLPILLYITLRNLTPTIRTYHSLAMAWVGRCSLETYVLSIHLFTASTSQAVLLIDGLSGGDATFLGRLASLLIIIPISLWASSEASKATTVLVKVLLGDKKLDQERSEQRNVVVQVLMMPAFKIGALLTVMWTANLLSPEGMKEPMY